MIGIRREDKNRWERRAPLTPDHVAEMVRAHGIAFAVQPSPLRVFPDVDYQAAGARISEDLGGCPVILGIKEIPPSRLLPGRTYLFFAHVAKGQRHNMPMLRRLLETGCTLIDYERIHDARGRRLVYFGRYAGHAGMIDALWALGQRLSREGLLTGLEQIRQAHEYSGLDEAAHHVSRVGERLRHTGIPEALHPVVFAFTGSGNVTRGAVEIFDRLPFQEVAAEDLEGLALDPERPRNVLFKVSFTREDRFERAVDGGHDAAEFAEHPERYRSAMGRFLPHVTVLVNGAFWEPRQPRLVSFDDLRALDARARPMRLRLLADLACDIDGAIEATVRTTTPGDPVYAWDPRTGETRSGIDGRGVLVLAVDNLPCELPAESSEHFGDTLVRYVPTLSRCSWDVPFADLRLPPELLRAVIVHRGRLTAEYADLETCLEAGRDPAPPLRP